VGGQPGPPLRRPGLALARTSLDAGFDHLVLVPVGPDQDGFFRFWREELGPRLRAL
jgi:tryptophanyl-tRNA synthetase